MSFLNQLVQPECGNSNPLVASAQQIAMRPTVSPGPVRFIQPNAQKVDYSSEFLQKQQQQTHQPNQNIIQQQHANMTGQRQRIDINRTTMLVDPAARHQMMAGPSHQHQMMAQLPTMVSNLAITKPEITAAEQLETKYREDMLASIAPTKSMDISDTQKDDIEFWQALSQKYVGPKTYNNETSELIDPKLDEQPIQGETLDLHEYIFDERNPLKDQFEDPFAEGLKKLEIGDITSAVLLFEAAVLLKPTDSVAWRYLGTTQAQNEKDNQAIRALTECLKLDSKDQEARLAVSVSLANENRYNEACSHLLEWLINQDRYSSLGASLQDYHKFDELISEDPFFKNSLSQKHYEYVEEKFLAAARMSPNDPDPEVQTSLGVLLNMQGKYQMAVDCFKAALSVRSNDSILWNRLGATLANGNKPHDAVVAYRKALEIYPGSLRSRYNLAISLIHLGAYNESAHQLLQILNLQASAKNSMNSQIRTRSVTSTTIWNTLRTVVTLMNKPEYYAMIDGRDLVQCNEKFSIAEAATTNNK